MSRVRHATLLSPTMVRVRTVPATVPGVPVTWRFPMMHRALEVVDGVHFYLWVGQSMNCNSVVVANAMNDDHPHVLVDPGMTAAGWGQSAIDSLAEAMEGDGLALEDVGLVFATHSHPDHYQAVDEVVKRSGAAVVMSEKEHEFFEGPGRSFYGSFGAAPPATQPGMLVNEGPLDLGPTGCLRADVVIAPGHTPGCACLYLPETQVLVSGDVVFPGSIGRMDFIGGSMSQMRDSIERLSRLDIEHILPGHSSMAGPMVSGRDNVARNFQMIRMFF